MRKQLLSLIFDMMFPYKLKVSVWCAIFKVSRNLWNFEIFFIVILLLSERKRRNDTETKRLVFFLITHWLQHSGLRFLFSFHCNLIKIQRVRPHLITRRILLVFQPISRILRCFFIAKHFQHKTGVQLKESNFTIKIMSANERGPLSVIAF